MKPLFSTLGRLILISTSALGLATYANWFNHKGYWEGTIHRVQTTDFNLLSHALPTKLSYALIQGETQELQRTVNSSYGLFGIVVTNCLISAQECPQQQVLFLSNSESTWRKSFSIKELHKHPYDLLRNPPPLFTEGGFSDSRATKWEQAIRANKGQIIGRVYYIRGTPPEFWSAYWLWVQKLPGSLLSDRGAQKYYALSTSIFFLSGLVTWAFVEWLFYRKRLQYQLAQEENGRMSREARKLQHQLKERLKEVSVLIEERQKLTTNLKNYQRVQESRTKYLEETITQLKSQLAVYEKSQVDTAQVLKRSQVLLLAEIKQREQTITALQKQIAEALRQQGSVQEAEEIKQMLVKMTKQQSLARQRLEQAQQSTNELQQQITLKEQQQQQTNAMLGQFQRDAEEAQEREQDVCQQLRDMAILLTKLQEEKAHLEKELRSIESPILNEFENAIFSCLEGSSKCQTKQWRVLTQLDVSQNSNRRQLTDIIVVSKACIFVIEAKYYVGKIRATGDARTTEWYAYGLSGSSHKVNSAGGKNPYEQVTGYFNSVFTKVSRSQMKGKIGVYGVVVFPKDTDIKAVEAQIGGQYRVTTLEHLVQVLQDLETPWLFGNREPTCDFLPKQVENLLLGKPIRKVA
jgi:hypothetical protein